MAGKEQELAIGEVAARSGAPASTIRYYESVGVLPEPRRVSGRRRYPPETVRRLAVIATAQRAGLSLHEITELLGASAADPATTDRLRLVAERRLPELVTLIERAEIVKRWLEAAAVCECPCLDDCPLFDDQPGAPGAMVAGESQPAS